MFLWIFLWSWLKVRPCLVDLWVPAMGLATLISSISWAVRVSCHSQPANLIHSGSLQLCSQNDWLLFLWLKKGGFVFVSDVELQSQFKAFSPYFLNCTHMDEMSTTSMKKRKRKQSSDRGLACLSPKQTLAQVHTQAVAFWLALASSVMLTHFMICSFSEWWTVSPSAAQKKTPVWVGLILACDSALGTLLGPF